MTQLFKTRLIVFSLIVVLNGAHRCAAQYAAQVLDYNAGDNPASGYTVAAAALGSPETYTGEGSFPGVVSPFNPPFLTSEIVSVGEGGQLTLRLSHYAIPQAGGPEIGVFTNVGMFDDDFPNGLAGDPPFTFGVDDAEVWVSEDGLLWTSLGSTTFDIPTNGYTDVTSPFAPDAGIDKSDFQQPFTGLLSDFGGLPYNTGGGDILELLAGSGGGTWLDISGTGLAKVGYVRFTVADDLEAGTSLNFELDAVSVSHAAMGHLTVPEPTSLALVALVLVSLPAQRRRVQGRQARRATAAR